MSSMMFKNQYIAENETATFYFRAAIGGTGAPTLSAANSKGIASIVRDTTGTYTVTLQDPCVAFMMANLILLSSTSRDLTFQVLAATSSSVQFIVHAGATGTDPTSGDAIYGELVFRRSGAY
jgi:hypothetical protein